MAEFKAAQSEYLEAHVDKFTDAEENKLEYTTVHEGYIYILENVIETELHEHYDDDEIN